MLRIAVGLIVLAAGPAAAQAPFEAVRQPELRGFEQIVRQHGASRSVDQWVPRGETLLRWSRMVTVQRFGGLGRRTTPSAYLVAIRRAVRARCPGARIGQIKHWALSTYPTAQMWAHCPRDPSTNRPESFIMQAMAGYADLYVVQVAMRPGRMRDEFAFARGHLAGVTLCGLTSREAACRDR